MSRYAFPQIVPSGAAVADGGMTVMEVMAAIMMSQMVDRYGTELAASKAVDNAEALLAEIASRH